MHNPPPMFIGSNGKWIRAKIEQQQNGKLVCLLWGAIKQSSDKKFFDFSPLLLFIKTSKQHSAHVKFNCKYFNMKIVQTKFIHLKRITELNWIRFCGKNYVFRSAHLVLFIGSVFSSISSCNSSMKWIFIFKTFSNSMNIVGFILKRNSLHWTILEWTVGGNLGLAKKWPVLLRYSIDSGKIFFTLNELKMKMKIWNIYSELNYTDKNEP